MKRDMDLVRQILFTIEGQDGGYAPSELQVEGYTEDQVGYHVLLMIEGKLLVGEETSTFGSTSPTAVATRMTWNGHEFLEAAREQTLWNRAKAMAARAGSSSFTVLTQALTQAALENLG